MYDELLDDPKVQRLSGDDFKGWVNLLCLMSRGSANLSDENDIAFALRIDVRKAKAMIARLVDAGLIIKEDQGFEPYKWNERQYKSDVSTDRVKRFRERSKTVSATAPDTEADTETEKKEEGDAAYAATSFAFSGKTIRLNEIDLHRWRKTYHAIPGLEAELMTLDGWWQDQPAEKKKRWFHATQAMLNRKHQELLAKAQAAAQGQEWISPC
jgi:hypothetical protein